jgi:hypothetical protein
VTAYGDDDTEFNIYGEGGQSPAGPRDYPPSQPPLGASPYYLPNLIAAIVACIGIVVGSIGTWASLFAVGFSGIRFEPWGTVALALGAASAIALFVQLNIGRTLSSLRWSVPLCWAVLVAGVGCLAIALVNIVKIRSVGEDIDELVLTQVGWGLWLMAICAVVLVVTAPIVAGQITKAAEAQAVAAPNTWGPVWRWVAVIASAGILIIALYNAYTPTRVNIQAGETETQTATQTVTAPPVTIAQSDPEGHTTPDFGSNVLPADATPCPINFSDSEFGASAVGTKVTSCAFAEAVRYRYVNNSVRNGRVALDVVSPVTHRAYTMSCTGGRLVQCVGGDSAVVYIY